MIIQSSTFDHNRLIPKKYTCDGQNINPPLVFSDVPKEAKSLALIMDDPDAPAGTWVHWVLYNIDPKTTEIAENSVPNGAIEVTTSFGKPGYGGPCPPDREHRYFFKLYALNTTLTADKISNIKDLKAMMASHIIDQAESMGRYDRVR